MNKQNSLATDADVIKKTIFATSAAYSRLIYQTSCITNVKTRQSWEIPHTQLDETALQNLASIDNSNIAAKVVESERALYKEIVEQCFAVMPTLSPESQRTVTFSFNIHWLQDGAEVLLTHHATPLLFDDDGKVLYALSLLQPALNREAGSFFYRANGKRMEYDFVTHQWMPLNSVNLKITQNERQMLILSARGYTLDEISTKLGRATDTVKLYRRRVFDKLHVNNITEALYAAMCHQLI